MDIYFRVALSPLPQLCKTRIIRQYRCNYWDDRKRASWSLCGARAVPIVEAMAAIVSRFFIW
jgi:hypothetical protein